MGIFRGISNHLNKHFRDERGGVFSFLLGGVALLAVVTFGLYQVLSGPVTSGARVQGTLLAQHQLMTNARIASADAVEVIGDFLEHVREEGFSENELEVVASELGRLRETEDVQ